MTPLQFLFLIVTATLVAAGVQWVQRQRNIRELRDLADEWQLHFSAADPFRLAPRVALALPVPGAAAVRVTDLIYGLEGGGYRYIFRTEYTIGVLRTKTSIRRVVTFREAKDAPAGARIEVLFAPEEKPLIEQYRYLYKTARAEVKVD
jgi:hypothetical protein